MDLAWSSRMEGLGMIFSGTQQEMAWQVGYDTVDEMNRQHDPLHVALCAWLGIPSESMKAAQGLPHDDYRGLIEEDAVMHVQRLLALWKIEVPTVPSQERTTQ